MEFNQHHTPIISLILSIFSGILSWLSLNDAQYFVSFCASIIALISGILAMRYYYYAGEEKRKNQLKSDKNGE